VCSDFGGACGFGREWTDLDIDIVSSSADDEASGSKPSCHLRIAAMRFLRPR
jgi:hypothetical protein